MRTLFTMIVAVALVGCSGAEAPLGGTSGSSSGTTGATGSSGSSGGTSAGSSGSSGTAPEWVTDDGITAEQLGVLVDTSNPISVAVAEHYVAARGIPARNVVRFAIDAGSAISITPQQFAPLKAQADAIALDAGIEAWAITWTRPYQVGCMSVGTAFAAGYDGGFCAGVCQTTLPLSTYDDEGVVGQADSAHRPFERWGVRPTMMLATDANDAGTALAVIDRGIASDGTDPRGTGYFFRTTDSARSVRYTEFLYNTLPQWVPDGGLDLVYVDQLDGGSQTLSNANDVLFYFQGLANVPNIATNTYRPGAVADHLTSYGGQVPTSGQMSVLAWLKAGATASYGTVVEPCNYTTKFANTTVLLSHYYRGEPIIEAYWKSVQMPGQGLFVGEPLARPWIARSSWDAAAQKLTLTTTSMRPGLRYRIEAAASRTGPWSVVRGGISIARYGPQTLAVQPASARYYRLVRE